MTDIAIRASHLSKCYQIYNNPHDRLKQFIAPRLQRLVGRQPKQYFHEFWALNDVSFDIKKGETVGIIGRNGSGKSTLLQLICGTLTPSNGQVEINGRVAALLELGSGFNPEFTGRENVYMNAAVLGLSHKEVTERFDDIAAFADIGEFIEQAVKTYSSGMFVRLAFAVNILSNPDVMIVDEALAVGDMNFQSKCMTALKRIQDNGATVLFVSHDISALKSLCSRGIYLDHGQLKNIGTAADISDQYMRVMREEMNRDNALPKITTEKSNAVTLATDDTNIVDSDDIIDSSDFKFSSAFEKRIASFRYGDGGAKITYVELLNEQSMPINHVEFDQTVLVRVYFETAFDGEIACNYYIANDKKILILGCDPILAGIPLIPVVKGGRYIVTYKTRLPLGEGHHSIQVQLTTPLIPNVSAIFVDVIDDAVVFSVSRRPVNRIWTEVFIENAIEVKSC
ncbi:MAG: ABC transporter ATP-binding protein [Methylococcales bacterium]